MNYCLLNNAIPGGNRNTLRLLLPKHLMLLTVFMFLCFCVFAQQKTVSGTVTGNNNQLLPGVSVIVQNTTRGTSTDNNGRFSITAANSDVLLFRSIGYQDQTVTVGDQTNLTIHLINQTDTTLNDVVVIGYQTVRRRDLTGATAVVNTQNTSKILASNVADQLQGQVPGVTVRNTGNPG